MQSGVKEASTAYKIYLSRILLKANLSQHSHQEYYASVAAPLFYFIYCFSGTQRASWLDCMWNGHLI